MVTGVGNANLYQGNLVKGYLTIPKKPGVRPISIPHPLGWGGRTQFDLLRSGCAWRMLPHEFPPWKTVYHYFRLWRLTGFWERINASLRTELRIAYGRKPEPSAAILDSQSVKTTETPGQALIYAAMVHIMIRRLARIKTSSLSLIHI